MNLIKDENIVAKKILTLILVGSLSSCFQSDPGMVSQPNSSGPEREFTSEVPGKKNIIHNFISYKKIDLEKELKGIQNIESVSIKNQNETSSLFISSESLAKKKVYQISSGGDFITLSVTLKNGSSVRKVVK